MSNIDLVIGPNRLSAEIETRFGLKTGPGPLLSVLDLQYTVRLSEAGDFRATIALSDPRARLILPKQVILAFFWDDEFLFRGVVEHTAKNVDSAGVLRLSVSGRDLCAELAEATVRNLMISDGAGAGVLNAPYLILEQANLFGGDVWLIDAVTGYIETATALYAQYSGESALSALVMASQKLGEHWRLKSDGTRQLTWLRTDTPDSGVRAISTAGEPVQAETNPYICFIQNFTEEVDAYRLVTRVYPYGAGDGDMRVTLEHSNRVMPTGFTMEAAHNYIESDDAIAEVGKDIATVIRFKDIRNISNTSADVVSASNQLADAALAFLQRNDTAADLKTYRLTVAQLSRRLEVGEIIRVEYDAPEYHIDNEQMVVLAIRQSISSDGTRTAELTVSGVARWLQDPQRDLVQSLEQGRVFSSHPQTNAAIYRTAYKEHVFHDGTNSEVARVRFFFGLETYRLDQVAFDFETADGTQMLPLESTVRSVSSVSTSTTSGGSSTPTTSSGGASTPTTTSGGGSLETTTSEGSHSHDVTIPNHDHNIPDHEHEITVAGGTGGDDLLVSISGSDGFLAKATGGDVKISTNPDSGSTTSDDGGGTTETSASGGSHSHSVTVSGHSHSVTISAHSHTVTISGHTHDVTPNITTVYGLYRETGSNTFNLADLEYRVNSGSWNSLFSDVTSLGSNWYRLDITEFLYDATFVPLQDNNLLEFRRKTSGSFSSRKSCMIDGQLLVRSRIQSVALL